MAKRPAEPADQELGAIKNGDRPMEIDQDDAGEFEFEDEYEDEFESEDEIFEAGVDGRPDAEREADERENAMEVDQGTFIPGRHKLSAGETLSPDLSTYELLHTLDAPWPCLSCDIIPDSLGSDRKTYPATVYAVAGTQAARGRDKENQIMVMKMSSLSRMEKDDEEEDDDEDDEASDPILETKSIPMNSCTNRIRAHQCSQTTAARPPTTLTAAMTESGQVLIHDITPHLTSFDTPGTTITPAQNKPICTIRAHKANEGYALDWSPLIQEGKLLTGDVAGNIFATTRTQGGGFVTDTTPYTGHQGTVEELQWSPTEKSVFASASNDGTVKIWDARSKSRKAAVSVQVSNTDVNVLSWSHQTAHLLASGADDGEWAVWDLRQWKPSTSLGSDKKPSPVASFNFHKEQITAVEWHPTDDSIVLVCAGDNTLTLWDLAVELDDEESRDTAGVQDVPPQLLFVHYMEQVKEAHWHPQIPGTVMATGGSGFGVFKTISV
ncbi:glutamate-rich WD repeat-containing protein-like protein 1 [Clohesyomyces aquaticus]|uniref:Glutamate-rich WD repeat-containing protein-like protein 1 n=1 Tax=Clohesyomyces aquaticus TaxID=1231657 RepID=A0A1Y1ZYA8_9PLEO|nr:glutamate-rich WD repeat-containing protein-like protein 1 [Clohesyomyces aquaticus]